MMETFCRLLGNPCDPVMPQSGCRSGGRRPFKTLKDCRNALTRKSHLWGCTDVLVVESDNGSRGIALRDSSEIRLACEVKGDSIGRAMIEAA